MAKINYQIGEGVFSTVMLRIRDILLIEFTEQINLGNTFLPDIIYFDTDFTADEGNIPWVSVNWLDFDNLGDNRGSSTNLCRYFIDVKAEGYANVRKIVSVIRTILKSMQYDKLDFAEGVISETNITSSGVSFEPELKSSQGVVSGGLTYQCKVLEPNDRPVPDPLNESEYVSQINETNKSITIKSNY